MNLRESIIAEMKRHEEKQKKSFGELFHREAFAWYCTWWFKFEVDLPTKAVRVELNKMEKEGIVKSCHKQTNNTRWMLIEAKQ